MYERPSAVETVSRGHGTQFAAPAVVFFALGMKPEPDVDTGPTPERRDLRLIGVATGLGCSIVAALVLCIGAGIWLDDRFGTRPVLTLLGVVIGLAAAGRQLWQLAKLSGTKEQTGPVSPQMTGRSSSRAARNLREQAPEAPDREYGIEE